MANKLLSPNKRKNPRVDKKYCVKYYSKHDPAQRCDIAQIKDISKGGVRFWSTKALSNDVVMIVELHVPYVESGVKIEALVVGCNEKVKDIIYEVRLKFINLTAASQSVLEIIEKRYHQEVS